MGTIAKTKAVFSFIANKITENFSNERAEIWF